MKVTLSVDDQKWQQVDQAGTAGLTVSYRRFDRLCSVADPAIRHTGGQTACDSRLNRLYESAQNVNLISPLRSYRRGGQDAYVDRLIRSPDEEVMALTRISAAQAVRPPVTGGQTACTVLIRIRLYFHGI